MEFIPDDRVLQFLPDSLVAIRKIYNLDGVRLAESLDILDQWVKKQNHFVNKRFSLEYLERTLIQCKGSVEKAKSQIDKMCTLRTLLPEFFICQDLKNRFSKIRYIGCVVAMPQMTKEYQRIVLFKLKNNNFSSEHFTEYYRLVIVMSEYLKAHDYVNGIVAIHDFSDVNIMDLMTKLNIFEFQQFISILIEGFGAKLKGINVVSQSKVIDILVKTLKSVMSPKIAGRVHVFPTLENLYTVIDKDLLPLEYGGKEKPIEELQDLWLDAICSAEHEKYLTMMKASNTDESQRQTDIFNEHCMGLAGSFRTLTVD